MYVRKDRQKLSNGQVQTYVSLAHNVWEDMGNNKKRTKPIIFSQLGVEKDLDMPVVQGMRNALDRYLIKRFGEEAVRAADRQDELARAGKLSLATESVQYLAEELRPKLAPLRFLVTVEFGLRTIVEPIWERFGLKTMLQGFSARHQIRFDLERVVFGMVLNRLVDPKSKLACNDWLKDHAYFPEGKDWHVRQFYAALDLLHEHSEELEQALRKSIRGRMKPEELDLLLLDTTSTYFETDLDDRERSDVAADWEAFDQGKRPEEPLTPRPQVVNDPPMRLRGHSKDHRPNLPQVVIATVCTKQGFVTSYKTFPGNTTDAKITVEMLFSELSAEIAEAARPTAPSAPPSTEVVAAVDHPEGAPKTPKNQKVVVFDSGMGGEKNLGELDALPNPPHRITAVPLRNNKFGREEVISRVGRYRQHSGKPHLKLRVVQVSAKESSSHRAEMWIATRNRKDAERQHRKIRRHIKQIKEVLEHGDLVEGKSQKLRELLTNRSLKRYLTLSNDGLRHVINQARVKEEHLLAGMHLLRTTLTDRDPEEILDAYQQLLHVEDNFRTFKGPLRLRPMHHRLDHRIEAHVTLCVLSIIVLRELELRTGLSHRNLVDLFGPIKATLTEQGETRFWQRNEWPDQALQVLKALEIDPGPRTWGATHVDQPKG